MAVSVAHVSTPNGPQLRGSLPPYNFVVVDVTFDNSYPTGGEALSAASLGFVHVFGGIVIQYPRTATGTSVLPLVVVPDTANANVNLFVYRYDGASAGKATLEQAAAAFDASTFTARVMFLGY